MSDVLDALSKAIQEHPNIWTVGSFVAGNWVTWLFGGPMNWPRLRRTGWALFTVAPVVVFLAVTNVQVRAVVLLVAAGALCVTTFVGISQWWRSDRHARGMATPDASSVPAAMTALGASRETDAVRAITPSTALQFLYAEFVLPSVSRADTRLRTQVRLRTQQRLPAALRARKWKLIRVLIDGNAFDDSVAFENDVTDLNMVGPTDLAGEVRFELPAVLTGRCICISATLYLEIVGMTDPMKLPVGEQYCRITT